MPTPGFFSGPPGPPAPPERTYYVAPRRRRRRRRGLLPSLLLASLLFAGGFLLGRTAAAEPPAPPAGGDAPPVQSLASAAAAASPGEALFPEAVPEKEPLPAVATEKEPFQAAASEKGGLPKGAEWTPPAEKTDPKAPAKAPETADGWALALVSADSPLPQDFAVPELTELKNGHRFDSRAYPALQRMMDAARAEGLQPVICSSFRTWDKQAELFARKVQTCLAQGLSQAEAEAQAAVWVARPGTSEHQTGLAVDIVDLGYQLLDEGQEDTAVQKWLMAHCAEYGFILRYPTDKSGLTGVGYEPWHYRYVGEAAARDITERGLCLEEYLEEIAGTSSNSTI